MLKGLMRLYKQITNKAPVILYLPFFIVYIIITLVFQKNEFTSDEPRYLQLAQNILHGFYSLESRENISLWSGPGYPIILSIFLFFKASLLVLKLLNSLFLYLSLVLIHQSLIQITNHKTTVFLTLFSGFYFCLIQELYLIFTECFTILLVALILFFTIKIILSKLKIIPYAIGFILSFSFLMLTKIVFGFVIIPLIGCLVLQYIFKKNNLASRFLILLLFSLVLTLPYLVYTYQLTHKIYYWGSSGGSSLYWMSNPNQGEYGDWMESEYYYHQNDQLLKNHITFFENMTGKNEIIRDSISKATGIINIKQHPIKYIQNWTANISRMLFAQPFSYTPVSRRTYLIIIPNLFIICFLLYLIRKEKKSMALNILSSNFAFIFYLTITYLFISSLLSAYPRQFYIMIPMIVVIMSISGSKHIQTYIK